MAHPVWVPYTLAGVMMAIGAYCVARLGLAKLLGRRDHIDASIVHILMAFAMVGMLVPRWSVGSSGAWEVVFALAAVWFLGWAAWLAAAKRSSRSNRFPVVRHHRVSQELTHMFMASTMLYMYWLGIPRSPSTAGAGMAMGAGATAGDPGLTLLLVALLVASAIWLLDAIERDVVAVRAVMAGASAGGGRVAAGVAEERPLLAPRLEVAYHVAMSAAMGYMLLLMV